MPNAIFENNGIKFSQSGQANQCMVLCHGGWKQRTTSWYGKTRGDGQTIVPWATKIYFYSEDTVSNAGEAVFKALMARAGSARSGIDRTHSNAQLQDVNDRIEARQRAAMSDPNALANVAQFEQEIAALYEERKRVNAGTFSFAEVSYTHSAIKNYALYKHDSVNTGIFENHRNRQAGTWHADLDLMVVTATSKRHLSDAFNAAKMSPGGSLYSVWHYLACRVNRAGGHPHLT